MGVINFNDLREAINVMQGTTAPGFAITKVSAATTRKFLDFLEALSNNPLKILAEDGCAVITVENEHYKYLVTCYVDDEFDIMVLNKITGKAVK